MKNTHNLNVDINEMIFDLLEKMKHNYACYIGKKSITELAIFITGYTACLCDLTGKQCYLFGKFQRYIEEKYPDKVNVHWSQKLLYYHYTEENAFDYFYKCWEEFNNEQIRGRFPD